MYPRCLGCSQSAHPLPQGAVLQQSVIDRAAVRPPHALEIHACVARSSYAPDEHPELGRLGIMRQAIQLVTGLRMNTEYQSKPTFNARRGQPSASCHPSACADDRRVLKHESSLRMEARPLTPANKSYHLSDWSLKPKEHWERLSCSKPPVSLT